MSRDEELRNVMHAWFLRLDEGTVTEEEWKAIERAIYYFDMQPGLMHAMHNLQIRLNNCILAELQEANRYLRGIYDNTPAD